MKKTFSVAAIILLAAIAALLFYNFHWLAKTTAQPGSPGHAADSATPAAPQDNSANVSGASSLGTNANSPDDLASRAASPDSIPATNAVQTLAPLTVLDNARVAMHNYGATFGENPVGENSEITAALMGKNPKQINFITPESGLRVNDKGEMLDAWGTPFFFHQLSGKEMEIRSAGEDRKMWTFDDQVTR